MKIQFEADRARVTERISDNSYKVELYTGEYMQQQVVKIMALPKGQTIKVTIEIDD